MRVLIADSNLARLEQFYGAYAAQTGLEVCACSSAMDVFQQADETPINCFVLDESLFGISGHTMCRMLRKMPQYLRTPIYIVSSSPTPSQEANATSVGATEYISYEEVPSILEVMSDPFDAAKGKGPLGEIAGRTCFDDVHPDLPKTETTPITVSRKSMVEMFSHLGYWDREASILFSVQIRRRHLIQSISDRPLVRAIERTIEALAEPGTLLVAHVGYGCFVVLADREAVGSAKEFGARLDRELRLNDEIGVGLCPIVSSAQIDLVQLTTSAIRSAFWRLADARFPSPAVEVPVEATAAAHIEALAS